MGEDLPRWEDLQEEALRPIPQAKRIEWRIAWREWPAGRLVMKSPTTMDREELDDLVTRLVIELERRSEGPLTAARLLARMTGGQDGQDGATVFGPAGRSSGGGGR
jgi:hypothetical protein